MSNVYRIFIASIGFLMLVFSHQRVLGQLVTYTPTALGILPTNTKTAASNISATDLSTGGGFATGVCSTGSFFHGSNVQTTSTANAATGGDYYEFSITPDAGYSATYTSVSLAGLRNSSSATVPLLKFSYKIGSGSFIDDASNASGGTGNCSSAGTTYTFNFTDFTSTETVIFRIYIYNASSAATSYRFATITLSGSVASSGPTITLSSPSQTGASNITSSTTNNILSHFQAAVSTANATLNTLQFTTTGSYSASDLTGNFKLFYGTSSSFGSASQIATVAVGAAGTYTFASLSQVINSGSTGFFWITADASGTSGGNRTLTVSASPTLTFASGTPTGTIAAGGTKTFVNAATPNINLSGSISGFGSVCVFGTSSEQSYNVSGSNLSNDIVITPPLGFQISQTSGSGYVSYPGSITLTQVGGNVASTPIYVIFTPGSSGSFSGNISHTSTGATPQNQAVSGTGSIGTVAVSTTTASSISSASASTGGTSVSTTCGTITAKGVVWGTSANPTTSGNSTNEGGGNANFTSSISGLSASTTYHYRAYATNSNGVTSYGTNLSFTTLANPPTVVVNKYNSSTDEAELLVIQNNLNLQGLVLKDFSSNNGGDGGGKYTFELHSLWSSVPAGTLIVLRNDASAADVSVGDGNFLLDVGLQNTTYFTNSGGSWNPATDDMIMIKSGSASGNANNIHTLAKGTNGSQYSGVSGGYKQLSTGSFNGFIYVNNSNSAIGDYNLDAQVLTASSGQTFGEPNSAGNKTYICGLRGSVSEPSTGASGLSFSGITSTQLTLNWTTNGNGARRIVVARATATPAVAPTDGIDYNTSTDFQNPAAVNGSTGSGNVVVYDGTGSSVTVTNLTSNTNYTFSVYEYNGVAFCTDYRSATSLAQSTLASLHTSVQLTASSSTVTEGVGTVTLTVSIADPSTSVATTVQVAITSGTGTDADVNSYTTQTLTFPANSSTNQTLTITVTNDAIVENLETIVFTLQNVSGGQGTAFIGSQSTYTLSIQDNDIPNIVINEIHYNPNDGGGFTDANYEYLELYNNGATSVDISGYSISDAIVYTFPPSTIMTAGQYIVLAVNSATYPGSVQWTSGSLVNSGETITLTTAAANGGLTVDQVSYDDVSPWPTGANGSGPSLALINPSSDNALAASWAVSCEDNGTPGASNNLPCSSILYSRGSGVASTAAIWSTNPNGAGQTITALGGFSPSKDIVIQNGHTVEVSSGFSTNNLTVNAGGKLWRNSSSQTSIAYLAVHGNIVVDGTVGNGSAFDGIGLTVEGTTVNLSGTGSIDWGRIRKNTNSNVTSTLQVNSNAKVHFNGTAVLNNFSGSSTFNVTVASGVTLELTQGSFVLDGTNGASPGERGGTLNVNGTLTIKDSLLVSTDNATASVTHTIASGGVVNAGRVITNITGLSTLNVNSGGTINIDEVLILRNGTFNPNGTVKLRSTVSGTAFIDDFTSGNTGTYHPSKPLTVERLVPGGFNFHYISAPGASMTVGEWADDFSVVGASGFVHDVVSTTTPYPTLWYYNEAVTGGSSLGWTSSTNSGNGIIRGLGYAGRFAGTLLDAIVTLPAAVPSVTITCSNGCGINDGWNLIGNPYPTTINFASLRSANPSLTATVYAWNPATNNYSSYNVASNVGVNWASSNIASSQAVFVRTSSSSSTITFPSSIKTALFNPTFFKEEETQFPVLKLALIAGNGYSDETAVVLNSNYENHYEPDYDSPLPYEFIKDGVRIYSIVDEVPLSINVMNEVNAFSRIPLGMSITSSGNYRLKVSELNRFERKVYLVDEKEAKTYLLNNGTEITFELNENELTNRFYLRFEDMPEQSITEKLTYSQRGFELISSHLGKRNYSFEILNLSGVVIQKGNSSIVNGSATLSLDSYPEGIYICRVKTETGNSLVAKGVLLK